MRLLTWIAAAVLFVPMIANASGPRPGEYVCTEMKGTVLPCTPRHLTLFEGNQWQWSNLKGKYQIRGTTIRFDGPKHGPVVWGAAHFEGDSVIFVDKHVSVIFTRGETAR